MKKHFRNFALILICILCMPIFAACSGAGGSEIVGVKFTQEVYELDLNTPMQIDYRVYPNTAKDFNLTFSSSGDSQQSKYLFKDGLFTILDSNFQDMIFKVKAGAYSDTCTIKLKKYPTAIAFSASQDTVNSNGMYNLQLNGTFTGNSSMTRIDSSNYNIEVISSNKRVIDVDSTDGLVVYSTGLSGFATITAYIKNASGNRIFNSSGVAISTSMTLRVIDNIDKAFVVLDNQEGFLNLTNDYTQTQENTYEVAKSTVKMSVALFADSGMYLKDCEIYVISNYDSIAQVIKTDIGYEIRFAEIGTTRIEISSSATDSNGNPVKFVFYLTCITMS